MNHSYRFDPVKLALETSNVKSAGSYTSWARVCLELAKRHFNVFEAEAILRSEWPAMALTEAEAVGKPNTASALCRFLDKHGYKHRHAEVNKLVMKTFQKEFSLELDADGVPCRRGTMPGNPKAGTVLVPLGTPNCCDPTSETYWCM